MKRWLAVLLTCVMLLGCCSFAAADNDLFQITDVATKESSADYLSVSMTVKNLTGEAVHNLQLSVCFADEQGNIIGTTYPSASVRIKADKTIVIEALVKKELHPYAVYVDQVEYYDNNEEYHKTYLDNTEEFLIEVAGMETTDSTPEPDSLVIDRITGTTPDPVPEVVPEVTPETTPETETAVSFTFETEFSGKKRTGEYTGENDNGTPNGKGTFVSADDLPALVYEGNWADGKPAGEGHLKDEGFTIRFYEEERGEFDRVGSYDGDTLDGIPKGQGKYTAVNDEGVKWTYTGEFANGTFNGYGEQVWESDDATKYKGIFVDGTYNLTTSNILISFAEAFNTTISETGINFLTEHNNYFRAKTDIDPALVRDDWKLSAFKAAPQNYNDKLILLSNTPVLEVAETGTDMGHGLVFQDEIGTLYLAICFSKQEYNAGDVIEEAYYLPLNMFNSEGVDFVLCVMVYPGNKPKTEAVSEPEPEPDVAQFETPEGADRSIRITDENPSIETGKRIKLTAEITALTEDAPEKSTLVWSSDDTNIARVDANGNVSGSKPGTATISCALKDNPDVKAWVTITVIRPVTGVKLSDSKLTIGKGKTATVTATVSPKDASDQTVTWKSTEPTVATVSKTGTITAINGGDTEIICTTNNGGKTAKMKVHVPLFSINNSEYKVTSKNGLKIPVEWASNATLYLQDNGGNYFNADWVSSENAFQIVPLKAGKGSVAIYAEGNVDRTTVSIIIEHSAVYDNQSYPAINYDSAMRYPDNWKYNKVSFSGRVLQVMKDDSETTYRISSKGRYDNVVYVTIKNSDILTPVIEDDNVTVYGSFNGNKTYTSTFGQSITIPWVNAERINVK